MHGRHFVISFFAILLLVPILTGCDQIQSTLGTTSSGAGRSAGTQVQGTVLAKVNGEAIFLETFDGNLKKLAEMNPEANLATLDAKKAYLNDLITQELIYQEAKSRGLDRKKEVVDAVTEFKKGFMAQTLVEDETKGMTVEAAEIEDAYRQYKDQLATPVELRVREIVTSSENSARQVLIALLQGEDFARLARERSVSSTAADGGDLGFLKGGEKFPKFDEVVMTLDVGQVSQIFKGPDGKYYVVKLEEKKGGVAPTLNEIYDRLKEGLLQQKKQQRIKDLTDQLRTAATVEINEDMIR